MNWFYSNKSAVLGIDVSTTAIKLLELSKPKSSCYKVESYAIVPLPQNAVINKSITDINVVAETIKTAIKQSGTKAKHACVAVSWSEVITKFITIPTVLAKNDIEEYIMVEATQHIPYSISEVNLDFIVHKNTTNNAKTHDVLLVSSARQNIDNIIETLNRAALKTKIIDVESFAIENVSTLLTQQYPGSTTGKTIAIADLGDQSLTFNVLHDHKIIHTQEKNFGGNQLTDEIQALYGLSYEQAILAKQQTSLPEDYNTNVLPKFKKTLVKQLSQLSLLYKDSDRINTIDSILLIGGCAYISGLREEIEQNLKIPIYLTNPFANMEFSNKDGITNLTNQASVMTTACGLALRNFD